MFFFCSLDGRHALSYECSWERLANPSRTASRAIIGDLGDYLKSAFRYSFSANTFDNIAFPREGEAKGYWSLSSMVRDDS